ncbi:hypothetical protein GRS80_08405, partial [Natrialba sp. INN-245]|nr:hypothetical protein [Natrialba sp. INN-245]
NNGYFVSRLKESAHPVITDELREWRGVVCICSDPVQIPVQPQFRLSIDLLSFEGVTCCADHSCAIPLEGNQILDVVNELDRQYIDVEAEADRDHQRYS